MTQQIRRLGRLGWFVAMAGASWIVEACGGTASEPPNPGSGGAGTGGGDTAGTETGGSGTGGLDIDSGTGGTGGEGGLHDLPCE